MLALLAGITMIWNVVSPGSGIRRGLLWQTVLGAFAP